MSLRKDVRDFRRMRQILTVLLQNEFGYLLDELRLKGFINLSHQLWPKKFKGNTEALKPKRLLKIFEELNGTFIKLGQLLALRPDLIPTEYCNELRKLQDNTSPFSGKQARQIIETELKRPLRRAFSVFDETPIASASIGQVHLAALKDGTRVVVKVQKPNIEETFRTDIRLLYKLAALIEKRYHPKLFDPRKIVSEFERYTERELHYVQEAKNIERFFAMYKDNPRLQVPKVFWDYTTSKVLVMEHLSGKRLTDLQHLTPRARKMIVETIVDAMFEQVFEHGFFHADPHPGNFLLKRNGKLAMLDYGIVGRLDESLRIRVNRLFISIMRADTEEIARAMLKLGVAEQGFSVAAFKEEAHEVLGAFYNVPAEQINIADVFDRLICLSRKHSLKLPSDFVLLLKALMTLESVVRVYDPKFNFIRHVRPFANKLARQKLSPTFIAKQLREKTEHVLDFIEDVPEKSSEFLSRWRQTEYDLKTLDNNVVLLTSELDKSSNRISLGMILAGLIIASTMLLPYRDVVLFGMSAFSFVGFSLSFILILILSVSMLREKTV
ncbi:AarF/ABC1/UbiB kinase family protein [Candidatus Woesearchaeota archaeon]|nr:AarF/ABC1/UbiB kinase family protein [Candidatus Woesearchaeota archaeon]